MISNHAYPRPSTHFVSETTEGETCSACSMPATHKVAEEIPPDDPSRENTGVFPSSGRHPLNAYVCCYHFAALMGPASGCRA